MSTFDPWVTRLCTADASRPINRLTIPGTHDSGTLSLSGDSQCQDTTLKAQLMMGVRYLDIRLDSSTEELRVVHGNVHGSGNTDLYFSDVANTCAHFLTGADGVDATDETVFLQVKSDRGPDPGMHSKVIAKLKAAFVGQEDHLALAPLQVKPGPPLPTIGQVKGKLVLLRRYLLDAGVDPDVEGGTGVHSFASGLIFNDWAKSISSNQWRTVYEKNEFEWPGDSDNQDYFHGPLYDYRNENGLSFVIQDYYSTSNTTTKWGLVKKYLDIANGGSDSPDSWFCNFSSCASPKASATAINPLLKSYFEQTTRTHGFGTILMDFVYGDLVAAAYQANFP